MQQWFCKLKDVNKQQTTQRWILLLCDFCTCFDIVKKQISKTFVEVFLNKLLFANMIHWHPQKKRFTKVLDIVSW